MHPPLAEGKLPTELLERLLRHTSRSPLLVVGAQPGEDAAVAPGAPTIVITSDPITFTGERIGAYAVAVNANDIVAMGGMPRYLTTTLLLAPGTTEQDLERIFTDIADACDRAGILWVGGHTEITRVVKRTVVCGHAVGFLSRSPLSTGGARPGTASASPSGWAWKAQRQLRGNARASHAACLVRSASTQWWDGWMIPGYRSSGRAECSTAARSPAGTTRPKGGSRWASRRSAGAAAPVPLSMTRGFPFAKKPGFSARAMVWIRWGFSPPACFSSRRRPSVAEDACRRLSGQGIPSAIIGEITASGSPVLLDRGGRSEPLAYSEQDEIVKLTAKKARRT